MTADDVLRPTQDEKLAPAKVAPFLEKAAKLGLDVKEHERTGCRSWTISGHDQDATQLWIDWYPSARGGRLYLTSYLGHAVAPQRDTRRGAFITLDTMGDRVRRQRGGPR